jgi:hypothetical protein
MTRERHMLRHIFLANEGDVVVASKQIVFLSSNIETANKKIVPTASVATSFCFTMQEAESWKM